MEVRFFKTLMNILMNFIDIPTEKEKLKRPKRKSTQEHESLSDKNDLNVEEHALKKKPKLDIPTSSEKLNLITKIFSKKKNKQVLFN